MGTDSILFPNIGLWLTHVGREFEVGTIRLGSIVIGGFTIAYYGVVVAVAMVAGVFLAMWTAKKTRQNPDDYFSFAVVAIIMSLIGARAYYVIFSWDFYGKHPEEILNFRGGGLAIYGGIIAGVLTAIVFCLIKKIPMGRFLDTCVVGLAFGQAIGRWGNFFNREAFGDYTNTLLAMQLPINAVNAESVTQSMRDHMIVQDGLTWIRVHPTFLYESLWCLGIVLILLFVTLKKGKRFDGQIFLLYLLLYGIGRFWIEALRTDQLKSLWLGLPVSQVISGVVALAALIALLVLGRRPARTYTKKK